MPADPRHVRDPLLSWYREHRRELPWRRTADPYRIWISEIMLQQTTVAAATPYWERFVGRFPCVEALAAAPLDEVLAAWAGLGYYRRARMLHDAARQVAESGGRLPVRASEWRRLPGVGAYTAAAIASIAHGEAVPAIDGNAVRVLSRLIRLEQDPSRRDGRSALEELASRLVDPADPGGFNQALMELGARICRPVEPACGACPLLEVCAAGRSGDPERFPFRRPRRAPVPVVRGSFWLEDPASRVLLRQLPTDQANAGLWELPGATVHDGSEVGGAPLPAVAGGELARRAAERLRQAEGLSVEPGKPLGRIRHAITHHRITVHLFSARLLEAVPDTEGWRWVSARDAEDLALTSAGRRLLAPRTRRG